ncbi:MAG: hydrogenase maturation protease [Deferrisomatales bacterium]
MTSADRPGRGPIRVIGLGNPLRGDDGAGTEVARRLASMPLPGGVEVLDGGTGGLALLPLLEGARGAILVDAADLGCAPGTVVRLPGDDPRLGGGQGDRSPHQAGVEAALALGRELGCLPATVVLFLVQGARVAPGLGLSGPVRSSLDELVVRVRAEALRLLGRP